jgi:hypothetical protein
MGGGFDHASDALRTGELQAANACIAIATTGALASRKKARTTNTIA